MSNPPPKTPVFGGMLRKTGISPYIWWFWGAFGGLGGLLRGMVAVCGYMGGYGVLWLYMPCSGILWFVMVLSYI